MVLILDTGPIVAALDADDTDHAACSQLLTETYETLLIPSPVLVEVDYWLVKRGGPGVWQQFVTDITRGAYRVEDLTDADLGRAAELEVTYADLRLGLVDAAVLTVCERLGETKVASLDHRHFRAVKPAHCGYLDLLPG